MYRIEITERKLESFYTLMRGLLSCSRLRPVGKEHSSSKYSTSRNLIRSSVLPCWFLANSLGKFCNSLIMNKAYQLVVCHRYAAIFCFSSVFIVLPDCEAFLFASFVFYIVQSERLNNNMYAYTLFMQDFFEKDDTM